VLSGGGSDGTLGLKAIKENGGLTVAQGTNVTRPRFAQMPLSAVAAGFVDLVLPVEDIPDRIVAYVRNWGAFDPQRPQDALSTIYRLLQTRTGHDFSEYKDAISAITPDGGLWDSRPGVSNSCKRTRTRSGHCCATC
jgi:two-component system CheB/CheR fusion protein